jgi:lipopolysaccharide biosynthesis glycosyltransferase
VGIDVPGPVAIATVTSDDFVVGTAVMLASFDAQHPSFEGDRIVIHAGLSESSIQVLSTFSVRLHVASSVLLRPLHDLMLARPVLRSRLVQFLSLDAFFLGGYEKILFLDSDLLVVAPVDSALASSNAFVCTGDGPFYRGAARCPTTFREQATGMRPTFNAGFMCINPSMLGTAVREAILLQLRPDAWTSAEDNHTDQLVLNRVLAGEVSLLGPEFNYLLRHQQDIVVATGVRVEQARVLHFNAIKPWQLIPTLSHALLHPPNSYALGLWLAAYTRVLDRVHLRARLAAAP